MWPLAAFELARSQRERSLWARLHARQALLFGALASALFVLLLLVPLVASFALLARLDAIIVIYEVALLADVVFAGWWLVVAVRYAVRASRGELFDIPVAAKLGERLFPIRRRDDDAAT